MEYCTKSYWILYRWVNYSYAMRLRDIRNDGKYLDLWSVNHFLSGIVYTGWMIEWDFNIWFIFVTYFILAVAWELYEFYADVFEELGNKVMDVVTGVIGFFIIIYFDINL